MDAKRKDMHMARPNKVMQSYRLPENLVGRIENAADRMKVAKVDVVIEALEMYLEAAERSFKRTKNDTP